MNPSHLQKDGFRLRGLGFSRIDAFSDVVFGFALTLLVVSLEVPKTYAELHNLLLGFVPFGISFTFLIMIWFAHFRLFRRFGLHDHATIIVNAVLLFVVLFFVYPLKFLFTMMLGATRPELIFENNQQVRELMVVYGLGFAAIYLLLAALYRIGWQHRDQLQLNSVERLLTRQYMADHIGVGTIGLLSALVAVLLPRGISGYAGCTFFLIIAFKMIHGRIARRSLRKAQAEYDRLQFLSLHSEDPAAAP